MASNRCTLSSYRMAKNLIVLNRTMKSNRDNRYYLSDRFKETVRKYPNKVAIIFEDRQITFRELDELSNKIANILRSSGLRHGDSAAIFMENSLEYLPVFLALCKIGVTGERVTNCTYTRIYLIGKEAISMFRMEWGGAGCSLVNQVSG